MNKMGRDLCLFWRWSPNVLDSIPVPFVASWLNHFLNLHNIFRAALLTMAVGAMRGSLQRLLCVQDFEDVFEQHIRGEEQKAKGAVEKLTAARHAAAFSAQQKIFCAARFEKTFPGFQSENCVGWVVVDKYKILDCS